MIECVLLSNFSFHKQSSGGYRQSIDKLNKTMVFSEAGDAYTDSQHINDGILTLRSRDLANSPYNFDKNKILGTQRESSVCMYQ